jgi:hypothetical protein
LPSNAERSQVLEYLRHEQTVEKRPAFDAWSGVCQALFGSAEFLYVR